MGSSVQFCEASITTDVVVYAQGTYCVAVFCSFHGLPETRPAELEPRDTVAKRDLELRDVSVTVSFIAKTDESSMDIFDLIFEVVVCEKEGFPGFFLCCEFLEDP